MTDDYTPPWEWRDRRGDLLKAGYREMWRRAPRNVRHLAVTAPFERVEAAWNAWVLSINDQDPTVFTARQRAFRQLLDEEFPDA